MSDAQNLDAIEIKAFVPARDLELSKAFYIALGFEVRSSSEELAYMLYGNASFLLQQFHVEEHANNYMMHLQVENVDDWHAHVIASGVVERFGSAVGAPKDQPWGIRDFTLVDPTGVLWRVGQIIRR